MRPTVRQHVSAALAILYCMAAWVAACAIPAAAQAGGLRAGDLVIETPWARATPPGAIVGAGYFVVRNGGTTGDRLVGATTTAAAMVQIHEVTMADGAMQMRERPGVDIPPGGTVRLEPGGLHLMLMDLAKPLVTGESVPVTLEFAKAGRVTVELSVAPPGAPGPVQ